MFVAFEIDNFRYMKKILSILCIAFVANTAFGQVVKTVWSSDFENGGAYPPCSDTSNYRDTTTCGSCTQSHGFDWGISKELYFNGQYSDSARVHANDTLWFTTCPFSTVGDNFVTVEFNHICKISFFDAGLVQVSNDSGNTWHSLGMNEYINIKGASGARWFTPSLGYGAFNELTYSHVPPKWYPATDSIPDNTWWEYEYFDVSAFLGGSNAAPNCMLRFSLADGPNTPGHENKYGWLIDSVKVKSSPCENIKPRGEMANPQIYHASLVYSLGPFNIYAKMWDEGAGFSDGWCVYTVNGGFLDSVQFQVINPPASPNTPQDCVYIATIPTTYNNGNNTLVSGDKICYHINIYDSASPCRNFFSLPNDPNDPNRKCNEFTLTAGRLLPYCDDFETPSQSGFWDTTMIEGFIGWELGPPSGFSAHSGTRAWSTVRTGNYTNNDHYTLNSPIFDFSSAVTPRITFWHRRNMPTSVSDDDRYWMEYSINSNPWQRLGHGSNQPTGDPNGKLLHEPNCPSTWYNDDNPHGFSGQQFNNQWRQSFYQLPASFSNQTQVQFRFVFKADNNSLNQYGVSIDDFCIYNPPNCDASVVEVPRLSNDFIKKAGELDSVSIRIRNLGTSTLTSIPVGFHIKDTSGAIDTTIYDTIVYPHGAYTAGLPPLSIDVFKFTKYFTVPEGRYQIFAFPNLSCDADSSNDTSNTIGHFGFVVDTISHFRDFDVAPQRWATTIPDPGSCGDPPPPTPTRWHLGNPGFGQTSTPFSPPNAWDINLATPYANNATEYLYTNMYDMSNADSAFLSFWHNRNTTLAEDGYYIEYSFNRFNSSARLTFGSQPIGRKVNWSNEYPPLAGSFGAGWSGLTPNWEYSQCPLNNAQFTGKTEVMFRFVFRSDNANVMDGVSIDDFRIVNPDPYDAEMFDIISPRRSCVMDIAEPVEIAVKNTGKDSLVNTPVAYRYRFDPNCTGSYGAWSQIHRDTIHQAMLPALTYTHIFEDSVNMSVFGCYEFCTWTEHPNDINFDNDTICGHVAENVEGCDIDLKLTTGTVAPDGEMLIEDAVTGDTLWIQSLTAIAANVVQWDAAICLYNIGNYNFKITASNPNGDMIEWWELRDPFADTVVHTDTVAGTWNFFWQCPPLLSASAERIRLHGPSPLPIPQTYSFDVRTRNRGSIKLSYLTLCLDVYRQLPLNNAGPIFTHCDSVYFGFPGDPILFPRLNVIDTLWDASPGQYLFTAWSSLPNGNPDSATHDDTTYLEYVVLDTVSTLPYCNDFDSDVVQPPWGGMSRFSYSVQNVSWEMGNPNQSHISSASSGQRAWMTRLDSNYKRLDSSGLYSPEFEIDTGDCYTFSFDHNFKTEHAFDGGTVEYTLDSGKTWKVLGGKYNTNDSCYSLSTSGWYNTPYVTGLVSAPNPPGWTSISSSGWRTAFRDVKFPDIGQNPIKVVFRFRFGADASIEDEGWAVDNFCLEPNGDCIYYCCWDGIQNGQEDSVDCGGPDCKPCPSCDDGVQNQNEQGVDCGGVCKPCPNCLNGVLDTIYGETAPDCGGPNCPPCPSCNDSIQSLNWVEVIPGTNIWLQIWEKGVDCGIPPCEVECWVGIEDVDPNTVFIQMRPNPANTETMVRYQVPQSGDATLIIRDMLGKEMYRLTRDHSPGIYQARVDVSSWSAGIYYAILDFNGEQMVEKLVVRRE